MLRIGLGLAGLGVVALALGYLVGPLLVGLIFGGADVLGGRGRRPARGGRGRAHRARAGHAGVRPRCGTGSWRGPGSRRHGDCRHPVHGARPAARRGVAFLSARRRAGWSDPPGPHQQETRARAAASARAPARDDLAIALTYCTPYVSGLTNMARDIAEGLAARGRRVTVVTSHFDSGLPLEEEINGVRVLRAPVSRGSAAG